MDLALTPATLLLLVVAVVLVTAGAAISRKRTKTASSVVPLTSISADGTLEKLKALPGPKPAPVIGNLHQLGKYGNDLCRALSDIAQSYGEVFSLKLGSTPAVVVSSLDNIREVLIKKGNDFGDRPDFLRWNALFNNDRNKSVALSDWSELQKGRRAVARSFMLYKQECQSMEYFQNAVAEEMLSIMQNIEKRTTHTDGTFLRPKSIFSEGTCNIFLNYMCSTKFSYDDAEYKKVVGTFDNVFDEVNTGYAVDFLPWLEPLYKKHMTKIAGWSSSVRTFILNKIVNPRLKTFDQNNIHDLVDGLLSNFLEADGKSLKLNWEEVLFELEDLIGGHSALANFIMRVLAKVAADPAVQHNIQSEVEAVCGERQPQVTDKPNMPYTEGALMETLRFTSSPIVPHVASINTSISGYNVEKGTVVLFNTHNLNTSESLWETPKIFNPARFVVNGKMVKPAHFLPFSTGKRSCLGSRLLLMVSFTTISTVLQKYNLSLDQKNLPAWEAGKLSMADFPIKFTPRNK